MQRVKLGATAINLVKAGTVSIVVADVTDVPDFLINPYIVGSAIETVTVSVDVGTVVGTAPITYTYQWKRDGIAIGVAPVFVGTPVLVLA